MTFPLSHIHVQLPGKAPPRRFPQPCNEPKALVVLTPTAEAALPQHLVACSPSDVGCKLMSNLLDDISLVCESPPAQDLPLSPEEIQRSIFQALGALVQVGVSLRSIWQLDDLVSVQNFMLITTTLGDQLSAAEFKEVLRVLLFLAKRWVEVDAGDLASLLTIAALTSGRQS